MAIDYNGTANLILLGLTEHVFGNMNFTVAFLLVALVIFALLIKIPAPFAFALNIPVAVVFTAYGYLDVAVGGLLSVAFLVIAVVSFLAGVGAK